MALPQSFHSGALTDEVRARIKAAAAACPEDPDTEWGRLCACRAAWHRVAEMARAAKTFTRKLTLQRAAKRLHLYVLGIRGIKPPG